MEVIDELIEKHKAAVKAKGFTDEQIAEAETELYQYRSRSFQDMMAGTPSKGWSHIGVTPCSKAFMALMVDDITPIGGIPSPKDK